MNDANNEKRVNSFVLITVIQAIFVLILISTIFFCKYFSKESFLKITDFYKEKVCTQTDVYEVLKGDYFNEI